MNEKQLSLYLHTPFCSHKCGYCDFNSWAQKDKQLHNQWVDKIIADLRRWSETLSTYDLKWKTVFWGGGTPSLLSEEILLRLGAALFDFGVLSDKLLEFTVEVNPEDLNKEKLHSLQEMGVNRLSMGIQTFSDNQLAKLERQASSKTNHKALELLSQNWKGAWSADLMYGLSGQKVEEFESDLRLLLDYKPKHISLYQLTLSTERSKSWLQAEESELADFFTKKREMLLPLEFEHYEISNFAMPGFQSLHNRVYWELGEFLGVGPGAYGMIAHNFTQNEASRFGFHQKAASRFEDWIAQKDCAFEIVEQRDARMHVQELLLMGLRLKEGVKKSRLGAKVTDVLQGFSPLEGLLCEDNERVFCTEKGLYLLDTTVKNCFRAIESLPLELDYSEIDPIFGK